jgi:transposase InsO family protein
MPWKVAPVSELRVALVHCVRTLGRPVTRAAREFGVSRKTANKWLAVYDAHPDQPLVDRSRRPNRSPARTADAVEQLVVEVRRRFNWGPRKIHAYLRSRGHDGDGGGGGDDGLPSVRTVANVLKRHGCVRPVAPIQEPQRFERPGPNELWQVDHKGPVEVQRQKLLPLNVLDDHSRYCLAFEPLVDRTMARAWDVLWDVFGDVGLPDAILTDNAFNTMGLARPVGLSWFDARLVRLGVRPLHGRPYHPQTQGKVERLNGSADRELIYFNARRDSAEHFIADAHAWRHTYNHLRPHEALGDEPPAARWRPSQRKRPAELPEPAYPAGSLVRKVCREGVVRFAGCRILVGRGISSQLVRIEDHHDELKVFYCDHVLRSLSTDQLVKDRVL